MKLRPFAPAAPWTLPVLVGLVLRLIAARGYGYFAADDYRYVLEPAWHWLQDPAAPFPSHYRSQLLPRVVWLLFSGGRALGIEDPARLLSFAYASLGVLSLVAIPAVYALARRRFGERAALLAAWLMAAQALMPHLATRALIEVVAIVPLAWALALFDRSQLEATAPRTRYLAAAGALLGLAAMLRFQLGVLAPVLVALAVWSTKKSAAPRPRVPLLGLAVGLVCAGVAEAWLDRITHDGLLAAPLAYVRFNLAHASSFGTSPWYSYAGFFLALTLPPATLALARPLWRAARAHPTVSVALLVFVVAHSLVGHKEERFMFPMLPLVFVLLGAALAELEAASSLWAKLARRWFWGVNAVALLVVTLSNSQQALIRPLVQAYRDGDIERVVHVHPRRRLVPSYYLGERAELIKTASADEALSKLAQAPQRHTRLLLDKAGFGLPQAMTGLGYRCAAPVLSEGDVVDRLLVAIAPNKNRRRAPLTVVDCVPNPSH